MALIIPPGFAQISVQFRSDYDPDPWYITFGVDTGESDSPLDTANAVGNAVAADNSILAILSNQVALTGVQVRQGQDGTDPLTLFYPQEGRGLSSSEMLPQNCAALVTKVTSRPGRTGKGRFFLPGVLKESQVSQTGVIPGGALGDLQTACSVFFVELESPTDPEANPVIPMVLLHNGGAPGGNTPTVVDGLIVDGVISTQRRRLR